MIASVTELANFMRILLINKKIVNNLVAHIEACPDAEPQRNKNVEICCKSLEILGDEPKVTS